MSSPASQTGRPHVEPTRDADRVREVCVPVTTLWTDPDAPRHRDVGALADPPDPVGWSQALDAEAGGRLGLHGRTLSQLLLGEPALVLEERGAWVRVAATWQASVSDARGYPGWVRRAHLAAPVDPHEGEVAHVRALTTRVQLPADSVEVSCGTALRAEPTDASDLRVLLPGGASGTVSADSVRLAAKATHLEVSAEAMLSTARRFLGVRYLWGGTGAWGVDCSGLVHLVARTHRVLLPRDAADQAAHPCVEPVPVERALAGDLYFFAEPGGGIDHVGLASSAWAEGRWMLHVPEASGTGVVEEAPMSTDRRARLVSAGRLTAPG